MPWMMFVTTFYFESKMTISFWHFKYIT